MNKVQALSISLGIVFIVISAGYFLGWWEQIADELPFISDKGDLKVMVYDALRTTDTTDDKPLANVTISILSTELVKKTDANGTAYFSDVDVGDYQVQAEWGSAILTKNVTITKDAVATLTFLFNQSTS